MTRPACLHAKTLSLPRLTAALAHAFLCAQAVRRTEVEEPRRPIERARRRRALHLVMARLTRAQSSIDVQPQSSRHSP
eukprot:323037-Pleurochrysis_carterae.AAC.4